MLTLLALAIRADSGTLKVLYSFSGQADGGNPQGTLVLGPDGALYGANTSGGYQTNGTIYRLTLDGSISVVHTFNSTDGSYPVKLVLASNGAFYGITNYGGPGTSIYSGANSYGTIFSIGRDGSFSSLYAFNSGTVGAVPTSLILGTDGAFYGTAWESNQPNEFGAIFKMTPDGTVSSVYTFTGDGQGHLPALGSFPGNLVQSPDGSLYGTTGYGAYGSLGGSVFRYSAAQGLSTLHNFDASVDGTALPNALLPASDGSLYGTTSGTVNDQLPGLGYDNGTVFRIAPDGTISYLYRFNGSDGSTPTFDGLILGRDGRLYGTTSAGGASGNGILYSIGVNGGNFTVLHTFSGSDGNLSFSPMLQLDNEVFVGATRSGGASNNGVAYELDYSTPSTATRKLTLSPAGAGVYAQTEQCVTAQLQDAVTGAPIVRVPLFFTITGVDPASKTLFSNSSGMAQLCWTGKASGTDTLTVSNDNVSATAVINWLKRPVTLHTQGFINIPLGALGSSALLRFTAQLSDGLSRAPVAGRTISFVAQGRAACQAVTDASGNARCSTWAATFHALLAGGYQASFAGDPVYLPASADGTLLSVGK